MKKGLTLIEVMVAALIFSFISVALYALLQTGISVRRKVESKQGRCQNINLNLENIARQFRNTVFFKNDDSGFKGSIEDEIVSLEFFTPVFDYEQGYPEISKVKYWFEEGILYKAVSPVFGDKEDAVEVEVIDNLEKFEIVYFDAAGAGVQEWQDAVRIPQGVKISMEYKDEKGRVQTIKKHVFIYRDNTM